jgi:hypothetical protein
MRFPNWTRYLGLLTGALLLLGCGDSNSHGMRNMQPGTAPPEKMELQTKKNKKPLPPEPPSPKAPP